MLCVIVSAKTYAHFCDRYIPADRERVVFPITPIPTEGNDTSYPIARV